MSIYSTSFVDQESIEATDINLSQLLNTMSDEREMDDSNFFSKIDAETKISLRVIALPKDAIAQWNLLQHEKPDWLILYDLNLTFVRNIEVRIIDTNYHLYKLDVS